MWDSGTVGWWDCLMDFLIWIGFKFPHGQIWLANLFGPPEYQHLQTTYKMWFINYSNLFVMGFHFD